MTRWSHYGVRCIVAVALFVGIGSSTFATTVVLDDHFDDGVLDPSWNVSLQDATSWTFAESGTNLTVSDIAPAVINPGNGGTWAIVTLTQSIPAVDAFHLVIDFSWDSKDDAGINTSRAMQFIELRLLDPLDHVFGRVAMADGWIALTGSKAAYFDSGFSDSGSGSLPLAGAATVTIDRAAGDVDVLWNGSAFFSGSAPNQLSRVELRFGYYAYSPGGGSVFGNLAVDQLKIETLVPEPNSLLLLSAGLIAFMFGRPARR
jgi:hypothetical protein